MTRPWTAITAAVLAAGVLIARGQPSGEPGPAGAQPQTGIASIPVPRLVERLERLTPDDPMAYFLLGEEVAAESADRA